MPEIVKTYRLANSEHQKGIDLSGCSRGLTDLFTNPFKGAVSGCEITGAKVAYGRGNPVSGGSRKTSRTGNRINTGRQGRRFRGLDREGVKGSQAVKRRGEYRVCGYHAEGSREAGFSKIIRNPLSHLFFSAQTVRVSNRSGRCSAASISNMAQSGCRTAPGSFHLPLWPQIKQSGLMTDSSFKVR